MTDMRTGRRESGAGYLESEAAGPAYNGWKNYETWNVALWIGNDEGLYELAKYQCCDYDDFTTRLLNL